MSTTTPLRLGTRGSQLALYQARTVARLIADAGGPSCDIVVIKTSGDRLQDAPLSEIGGKRLFVKELEDALMRDEIDLAVHSSKDLPAVLPEGLRLAGVLPRADARDALVLPHGRHSTPLHSLDDLRRLLGASPTIGTSSVRRVAQLKRWFPEATFAPIRGNLDTRLRKLDAGDYDCLVLAAAGLQRLDLEHRISWRLPVEIALPAPGQGIIAVEVRTGDTLAAAAVERINDADSASALTAERALVEALGGGCQTPIGAFAVTTPAGELDLVASVISLDGREVVEATERGKASDAAALGARAAQQLLARGAGRILTAVHDASSEAGSAANG